MIDRFYLPSAFNFRDMGGYPTKNGRRVKRGTLYRSGTMSMLTLEDERQLASLGIAVVCDLRRSGERAAQPTRWCEAAGARYLYRDYTASSGVLGELLRSTETSPDSMRAAMLQLYRDIALDHAYSFRMLFSQLLRGNLALLFNCSAGKDRTGVAAMLLHHALNVPRECILSDYLITNEADFDRIIATSRVMSEAARTRPKVLEPLLAAHPDYLAAFIDELDEKHGGIDQYLADHVGVDVAAQRSLREILTE